MTSFLCILLSESTQEKHLTLKTAKKVSSARHCKISLISPRHSPGSCRTKTLGLRFSGKHQTSSSVTAYAKLEQLKVLKVKEGESSVAISRRTVLPFAREEMKELWARTLVFLASFYYASHCRLLWSTLFVYIAVNPYSELRVWAEKLPNCRLTYLFLTCCFMFKVVDLDNIWPTGFFHNQLLNLS